LDKDTDKEDLDNMVTDKEDIVDMGLQDSKDNMVVTELKEDMALLPPSIPLTNSAPGLTFLRTTITSTSTWRSLISKGTKSLLKSEGTNP
jgi:hypothetical protein